MTSVKNSFWKTLIIKLVIFSVAINFVALFPITTHTHKALAIDCASYGTNLATTNGNINDDSTNLDGAIHEYQAVYPNLPKDNMKHIAAELRANIGVQVTQIQLYAGSCNDQPGFENYKTNILAWINHYNTIAQQYALEGLTPPTLDWATLHPTSTPGGTPGPPTTPTHLTTVAPTDDFNVMESSWDCTKICKKGLLDTLNPAKWLDNMLCQVMCLIDGVIFGLVQWVADLLDKVTI